jgi:hypothetical protein
MPLARCPVVCGVRLPPMKRRTVPRRAILEQDAEVAALAFSPDGRHMASAS